MIKQRLNSNGWLRAGWMSLLILTTLTAPAQKVALRWSPPTEQSAHESQDQRQSLKQMLLDVQQKHNIRITYQSDLVEKKSVSTQQAQQIMEVPKSQLERAVLQLVQPMGLQFRQFKEDYYILQKQPDLQKVARNPLQSSYREDVPNRLESNASSPFRTTLRAYEKTISGTVRDEAGEGLPGVNVLVKNTTIGTVTDIDGNYSISAPDDAQTLVFSSVGYLSQEVTIGSQSTINVAMEPDIKSLEEVVVVGYGTQRKSDLTGAVSTVESEELNRISERRLETALQGRAAGVTVSRGEGAPGSQAKVSIRGVGTFNDNGPLYVIDGVPQEPGTSFNPQDVESIEVLKDASAAAIYGARAAHGVILITTKRGEAGKINVTVNSSAGIREGLNLPDFLNTPDYITLATEARANAGIDPEPSWSDPSALPNTDWGAAVFRRAVEQSHNLSVSGGSENATFFLSGAYDKEEGIYIDSDFERYSFRANSDFKIGILKVGESFLFTRTRNNPTAEDNRELNFVLRAVPTFPIRDPSNPLGGWGQTPEYNNGSNPVGIQEQTNIYNINRRVNGNVYAEVEPITGLRLRGSVGYDYSSILERQFTEAYDYRSVVNPEAVLRYFNRDNESYNLNLVLSYDKSLGEHNFSALAGVERFTRDAFRFDAQISGFPVDFAESFELAEGSEFLVPERNTIPEQYRLNSIFGRISYDYQGKYLFQANVRRDGSSRFGANNKYGVFPSASVGWRVSDEAFMQNVDWLSDLKVRVSYGILGSDRIGDFNTAAYTSDRSIYIFDPTGMDGGTYQSGFYLDAFTNENRKWEEVSQLDIGLDMGLLNNRLSVTLDYYDKTTNDLLVPVQLPLSFGVSTENAGPTAVPVNVGSIQNQGVELAINYRQSFNDWRIELNGNGAYNRNEVISLADDSPLDRNSGGPNNPRVSGTISRTTVGEPLGSFYGLVVDGVFQTQEQVDVANAAAPDGTYQENGTAPGDFRYRDLDGDGEITEEDRDFLGDPFPKFTFGLSTTIAYKGFDLSVFFQGVTGVDIFNANKAYFNTFYSDFNSTNKAFDRWTPSNPTNSEPRLTTNDPNGNFQKPSSYFVEDGSYLKLRNIQLGYNLSADLLDRIGFNRARVYVNAQNILTITNYSGLDPELSNGDGGNTLQGLDGLGRYPLTYLLSAGIQLGF